MLMNDSWYEVYRTRTITKPYTSIRMYVRAYNKRTPLYKTNDKNHTSNTNHRKRKIQEKSMLHVACT